MNIRLIHESISLNRPVITIGTFDGVHLGHRFILDQLQEEAKKHGGESVVVTLWPHPRIVLNRNLQNFKLLHTKEEKIRELGRHGIDTLIIVPFDREIASLTACEFVENFLVKKLGVEVLLLGYDNRFGRDGRGESEELEKCAGRNRFRIERLPEFASGLGRVSSTTIRESILQGDLVKAAEMLGYPYYLAGHILEGNHIGRKLGFPTANIHPLYPYKLIPMNGVYAIKAELQGQLFNGMLNIGFRPTMDSASAVKTIEAHLFDVSGDFYNEQIVIHFVKRIRNEMKFSGMEELKEQLKKDEIVIREFLE
jgi:riboflavin kinase/FMN adenylyltransferase